MELFVESMLTKTLRITNARNAKTLSPSHMKQCIMSESRFDFLRELVKNVPDINVAEEQLAADNYGDAGESSDTSSPSLDVSVPCSSSSNTTQNGSPSAHRGRNGTGVKRSSSLASIVVSDIEFKPTMAGTTIQRSDVKLAKQQSADAVHTTSGSYNQNFYTERNSGNHGDNLALDFSMREKINEQPVAKLPRIDSTPDRLSNPSCVQSTTDTRYQATKTASNQQPVINFDFTKGPLLTFTSVSHTISSNLSDATVNQQASSLQSETNSITGGSFSDLNQMETSHSIRKLQPSKHSIEDIIRTDYSSHIRNVNTPSIDHCQFTVKSSDAVNDTTFTPIPPPVINVDLATSPLDKINYSNMNFFPFQKSHSSSVRDVAASCHSQNTNTNIQKTPRPTHTHPNTTTTISNTMNTTTTTSITNTSTTSTSTATSIHSPKLKDNHTTIQSSTIHSPSNNHNVAPPSLSQFQNPILNINLTANFNSSAPLITYNITPNTTASTSFDDMDEDYDNI